MRIKTEFVIVHCSATPPAMDIGAAEIDRWHRQKGWRKIGYHYVIRRDGVVEPGRDLADAGAHCIGYNHLSVGICLVGGVDKAKDGKAENNFTPEQWVALRHLVGTLTQQYKDAFVVGHRDLQAGKDCPSFDVKQWVDSVLNDPAEHN